MGRAGALILALALGVALPGAARALCDVTYRVQPGDTLRSIAEAHLGDAALWDAIYYANLSVVEAATQEVSPGTDVFIPCPAGMARPETAPLAPLTEADLTVITGGSHAPLFGRDLPAGGMIPDILRAALAASPARLPFTVRWSDDGMRPPLNALGEGTDMGAAWQRPDCAVTPEAPLCTRFHLSDPLAELPIMLFVPAEGHMAYGSDADVVGRRLCRPADQPVADLDRADRRWITEERITLVRPETTELCFEQLMNGDVDAVAMDAFRGAITIVSMGLRGKAVPLARPLSRETLHAVIPRTHWRGTTHLYRLNAGLAALRASGEYEAIVARHLARFEARLR